MAADVVLLEPNRPGGALPGPGFSAGSFNARADPMDGVAGAVGKGLPSTAAGRRETARVGLILARGDGEPAPRGTRTP